MKTRTGFVSNSSSSSFVIARKDISDEMIVKLLEHEKYAGDDAWDINVKDLTVEGYVFMDNYDIQEYMDMIGLDLKIVRWQ